MTQDEARLACVQGMYAWKQLEVLGKALELTGLRRLNAGWWEHPRSGTVARTSYGCGEAGLHVEDKVLVYFNHRSDHLLSSLLSEPHDPNTWVFLMNLREVVDTLCGTP